MAEFKSSLVGTAAGLQDIAQKLRGSLERTMSILGRQRPATTLLCVIESRFVRADLDASGELLGEPEQLPVECDAITDLPVAVNTALKTGRSAGKRLWLLHDGLPNHVVSAPVGQVAGLNEDQLGQALLFELEQLAAGINANQQCAHALLSQEEGQNQYWINHAPKTLMAQLRRVARQHGSQFAGLLHPGGLPLSLAADTPEQAWARLEVWPDALIGLNGEGSGSVNEWVIQAGTKPRRIQSEVERWVAALGERVRFETLGDGVVLDLLPPEAKAIDLSGADSLGRWLSGWGKTLQHGRPSHCPLLEPPEDPYRERWLMAGGGVAALIVCLIHFGWHSYRADSLGKELAFLRGSEAQLKGVEVEVEKYRKQRDDLRKRLEPALTGRAAPPEEVLAALRQRFAVLLREVSINVTDGMVIEDIRTKSDAVVVRGVTLDVAEANGLAAALEARLRGLGWRIQPPRKKDLAYDAAGGPWEFEILLNDSGLSGFAGPAPVASGRQ